ncbi:MAG: DUF2339 domain-containing protein [Patescibacteria group bacterium]
MAARSSSALNASRLHRVQSALGYLQWTFILMLLLQMLGLATGGLSGGAEVWGVLPALLGIVAAAKLRGVATELLDGQERKAPMALRIAPDAPVQRAEPAFPSATQRESRGFGSLEIQRMAEEKAAQRRKPAKEAKQEPSVFENVDWEEWVGKKLLQKVGVLIVLIGMAVLLKYSFDNRVIGELGRIALGTLAAAALLFAGEWFHRTYAAWSKAFTGGGLALLYFTVWAAHVFYRQELLTQHGLSLPPAAAMILYSLITLAGAMASVRYRSQTIAWFTVLGGYLTPFLIDTPAPNVGSLSLYLAILAAGILALSWFQKWPYLSLAAFVLSQLYLFNLVYPGDALSNAQQASMATGFFLLFALPPLLYQFRLRRSAEADDIGLILLDGAVTFFAVVDALGGFGGHYAGLVSLVLAAAYITLAGAALRQRSEDALLVNTYALAGIGLMALALYAQMRWQWVAAGWAPFSVLLLLIAVRMGRRSIFQCAAATMTGSLFFLALNVPMLQPGSEALWHPLTSHWAMLSYVVFACLLAWVYLSRDISSTLMPSDGSGMQVVPLLHTIIALVLFAAVTFEATGLHWVITLPLTVSYLAFSVIAITVFALTGITVWFVAALLVQALVLLFVFVFGGASGMVSPFLHGATVVPFFHPWAAVSVLSFLTIAGFLAAVIRRQDHWLNTAHTRGWIITAASAQVWLHVTVEIQHMQSTFLWTDLFLSRVLSAWWILFTIPFFLWGIRSGRSVILRAAVAALCIPFLKDLLLMVSGRTDLYEVSLWTAVPLILLSVASQFRIRDLLYAAGALLAGVMAADMLMTIASDAGLLRTVWWAIAGLLTISIGFLRREQFARRLAIVIFAVTVIKLLFFDFSALSTGVRIIASILTGLLLIGASYLYQRFDNLLVKPVR